MRYRLKLKRLDFVSPVDTPAQETARVLLIKREHHQGYARAVKVAEELGLVFCWAFTSTIDGKPYTDLQGDVIDEDFIKAAADFMQRGATTDEMHDGVPDGHVVFAFPMTPDVAKAYGIETKTTGLMVALKPSPDVLAKFKSGVYTGVSIEGLGDREPMKRAGMGTCSKCSEPMTKSAAYCPSCGAAAAKRMAGARKRVVLTSEIDGHQHAIDLDDPIDWCGDRLSTTYATSEGAEFGHNHVWLFDQATGVVTIGVDSGHTHTVDDVVPATVLALFAIDEHAEAQGQAAEVLEQIVNGDLGDANVSVTIAARAPHANSPRAGASSEREPTKKELAVDPKELKKQLDAETAKNAELSKRAQDADKRAGAIAKLSTTAHTIWKSLTGDVAEAFLAKSDAERATEIVEFEKGAAIEYTATDGTVYTKRDDARLIAMAKRADSERAAREDVELTKRAETDIGKLGGTIEARKDVLKAIDAIGDEKRRTAALAVVKSGAAAVEKLFKSSDHRLREGFELPQNDTGAPAPADDPASALRKHVEKYQADNKIPTYQQALAKAIREDAKTAELYAASRN